MSHFGATSAGGFQASVTVDVPSGVVDGDRLILLLTANDERTITTPPTGWTQVREDNFSGNNVAMWVYERTASSEPADYTIVWEGDHWHFANMLAWSGDDRAAISDTAWVEAGGVTSIDLPSLNATAGDILIAFGFHWDEAEKSWDPALTEITNLPMSIVSAEEIQDQGATETYTLTADISGVMGATAILVPQAAVSLTNSADGTDGEELTVAESGDHGDAWGTVVGTVTYDENSYTGDAGLRWASGLPSGNGMAWTDLALYDFSARWYLRRDDTAEDGSISWTAVLGSMLLTAGGGLDWAGLALASGAIPADQWVRVEARRSGTTLIVEVYTDPQSLTPSASTSGTVTGDPIESWWWERWGAGGTNGDEFALTNNDDGIGPATLPDPPGFSGIGLPMFAGG